MAHKLKFSLTAHTASGTGCHASSNLEAWLEYKTEPGIVGLMMCSNHCSHHDLPCLAVLNSGALPPSSSVNQDYQDLWSQWWSSLLLPRAFRVSEASISAALAGIASGPLEKGLSVLSMKVCADIRCECRASEASPTSTTGLMSCPSTPHALRLTRSTLCCSPTAT